MESFRLLILLAGKPMDWSDIFNIIFGALLGLGINIVLEAIRTFKERKNIECHIRSELIAVTQALEISSDKKGRGWPVTETPTISPLSPATAGVLSYEISSKVVKVQWAIKMANELRLMAIQAARSARDDEHKIYAYACNDWLKAAKQEAEKLAELLNSANNAN
ncbi:MAG: hypothetical protein D3908_03440 [Candidatus Electrothrix sp. AUS4]|nr:hypothetical protein [Candidatus Electrothrix sp. AUS4]